MTCLMLAFSTVDVMVRGLGVWKFTTLSRVFPGQKVFTLIRESNSYCVKI